MGGAVWDAKLAIVAEFPRFDLEEGALTTITVLEGAHVKPERGLARTREPVDEGWVGVEVGGCTEDVEVYNVVGASLLIVRRNLLGKETGTDPPHSDRKDGNH